MRTFRLTLASWQMLQRLAQPTAALEFRDEDGRFHFCLHGMLLDIVRSSTIDALSGAGLIMRERYAVPTYVINEKGSNALRSRLPTNEILDSELPVNSNITVVSGRLDG